MRVGAIKSDVGFKAGNVVHCSNVSGSFVCPKSRICGSKKEIKANNWQATFAVLSALLLANIGLYFLQFYSSLHHQHNAKKD